MLIFDIINTQMLVHKSLFILSNVQYILVPSKRSKLQDIAWDLDK